MRPNQAKKRNEKNRGDFLYQNLEPRQLMAGLSGEVTSLPEVGTDGATELTNVEGVMFFVTGSVPGTGMNQFAVDGLWRTEDLQSITETSRIQPSGDNTFGSDTEPNSADITDLVNVNGTLFFSALTLDVNDNSIGHRLWKSDGTDTGTVVVDTELIDPQDLTNVNGALFFTARTDTANGPGYELWRSDGTANGTVMVKDINSNDAEVDISNITNVNGKVFFIAEDIDPNSGSLGAKLWTSDGTANGTLEVPDTQNKTFAQLGDFENANGWLFFSAVEEVENPGPGPGLDQPLPTLYKSDGDSVDVVFEFDAANINGLPAQLGLPQNFTNVNGTLMFSADGSADGSNTSPTIGRELWKSDGTDTGTKLVKDINTSGDGIANSPASSPSEIFTNANGTLFLFADDGTGEAVWKSDATSLGTQEVAGNYSDPNHMANANGMLFFSAKDSNDDDSIFRTNGVDVAKVAGTEASNIDGAVSNYVSLANANGFLFAASGAGEAINQPDKNSFVAINRFNKMAVPTGEGVSDAGIQRESTNGPFVEPNLAVKVSIDGTLQGSSNPNNITAINSNLPEPLPIDEVVAPSTLEDIGLFDATDFTNVSGVIYFSAREISTGDRGLWETSIYYDAANSEFKYYSPVKVTNGATHLLGNQFLDPNNLTNVDGKLFFSNGTNSRIFQVVRNTSRTSQGDFDVSNLSHTVDRIADQYQSIDELTNAEGILYFTGVHADSNQQDEVWSYAESRLVPIELHEARVIGGSNPSFLTNVNGDVYFSGVGEDSQSQLVGRELFRIDHTGTNLVKDINAGTAHTIPSQLTNVGGILYFRAIQDGYAELWRTDFDNGIDAVMVKDINPVTGSKPNHLQNVKGLLYFSATDGGVDHELWVTDGDANSTYEMEIRPDAANGMKQGSNPRNMTNVNGFLYFSAYDGTPGGRQLFVLDGGEDAQSGGQLYKKVTGISTAASEFTNVNGTLYFANGSGNSTIYQVNEHNRFHRGGTPVATTLSGSLTGSGLVAANGHLHYTNSGTGMSVIYDNNNPNFSPLALSGSQAQPTPAFSAASTANRFSSVSPWFRDIADTEANNRPQLTDANNQPKDLLFGQMFDNESVSSVDSTTDHREEAEVSLESRLDESFRSFDFAVDLLS